MLYRNEAVYKFRTEFLYANIEKFYKLASYSEMMLKFWEWDFSKFIKGDNNNDK